MMVRPTQNRSPEQTAYLEQLIQSNETVAVVFKLAQDLGHLLRKREGQVRLEPWKAAVRTSGIAELVTFVELAGRGCGGCCQRMQPALEQRDGRGVRKSSKMDPT
jgi:hypothetical protein